MSAYPSDQVGASRNIRGREWGAVINTLTFGFAAVVAVAAMICTFLATCTEWPAWVVIALAVPCAGVAVSLHIGQMGNDLSDILVGSIQVLVFAAILFPVFGRAERARQRNLEKPLPQSQFRIHKAGRLPQTSGSRTSPVRSFSPLSSTETPVSRWETT